MGLIVVDETAQIFLEHAGEFLYEQECVHSLMIGVAESAARRPNQVALTCIRLEESKRTTLAGLQTAGHNLILSEGPVNQVKFFAEALHERGAELPGVVGPRPMARAFADAWSALRSGTFREAMGQKLYQLSTLIPPRSSAGECMAATSEDRELLLNWMVAMAAESLPERFPLSYWEAYIDSVITNGSAFLRKVNGVPVSMAFATRPTRNTQTVNMVYSPPEFRRQGHASAVTAFVSQWIQDSGKRWAVLYTDVTNPTSNSIYHKLGYQEIADSVHYSFQPGP